MSIIISTIVIYLVFLATQCGKSRYHYSHCPIGCEKSCVSSGCSNSIDESPQACLTDCEGFGSCQAPKLLR